ncbi:MAG: type II secretion system inner membrane protein GspF [Deltaproteobacteria bacterium]|nr:type II secretion system inner membrane protein GspF [Deltaproteobacteria bacterium]
MPTYEYTALNIKGKTITDIIDAESVAAGRQKLRSTNIFPVSIHEVVEASTKKEARFSNLLASFSSRVKPAELAIMTRQLATLLGAGFPLVSALSALLPQTGTGALKKILSQIKDAIEEGSSFAAALSQYPLVFSDIYVNMVRSGESSGTLELVLNRLADISEKQQELSHRIRSAMAYPVLMSIVGILILFFLLTYIVPSITSIFADMKQTLPLPTRLLIRLSHFLRTDWWVLLIAIGGLVFGLRQLIQTDKGGYAFDRILLRLPIIGPLKKKLAVGRFSRTLGSLLENGVPLMAALGIVKNIVGNRLIADAIAAAALDVEKGIGLGKALSSSDIFPSITIQMIQVGENSGKLESMLCKMADIYEGEVDATVSGMTALLEPVVILVMAVVVGFIVLSICMPIFEMNQLVR